jgi:hypothetical protein
MLANQQCRAYSAECKQLSDEPGISKRRVSALKAMARTWTMLANQTERLYEIVGEEDSANGLPLAPRLAM